MRDPTGGEALVRHSIPSAGGDRFQLLRKLGRGSFGVVYEARDKRTGLRVALKELRDTSGDGIVRFKHEFRTLADLHHPNLVGLKELIEEDDRWLIVMELISGTDFLTYVSRAENDNAFDFDEVRLRGALGGMVEGLDALHGFGVVHRDLKPANVRVTPEGRAVLLDFGLAASIEQLQKASHDHMMGTVLYMAPEQAVGDRVGPAADLYALGVCLFEGLTGRSPFDDTDAASLLRRKRHEAAPRASSRAQHVPADLDDLCARLLAIDPSARPTAGEVRDALRGEAASVQTATAPPLVPFAVTPATFAGRDVELQRLSLTLAQTLAGALRIVLVEGESGVGKSELVAEFLRRTRASKPDVLTLYGRCYESEQVVYKAFDGCVDELARALKVLPQSECAALLPLRSAVLMQLFPVLRDVKSIAQAPTAGISADPTARRLEAFAALAALLRNLSAARPVVLVVDDLQWADAESFRLLQALVAAPEAPPILLLATVRPRVMLEPAVLAHVREVRQYAVTSVIELLGLPAEHALAVVRELCGPHASEHWLATIVRESEGHPLLLAELVRFTRTRDFEARGTLTLEQALRTRIGRLEAPQRALLELVALAARPYGIQVFARALGVDDVDDTARGLLANQLIRLRNGHELTCYHDRIRHAAMGLIAGARVASLHRQIAEALANAPDLDEAEQAHHWDLAGDQKRAVSAYDRASAKAFEALAFARADELCARAIELIEDPGDPRVQELVIRRARALASAGCSGEAARLYERAAESAVGVTQLRLRSQAAQHLVLSSAIGAGLEVANAVLHALGFRLPRKPIVAALRFAWEALRMLLTRAPKQPRSDAEELEGALDIATDLNYVIATVHPISYPLLTVQSIRRALRVGSPRALVKAWAWRGWFRALQGAHPSTNPWLTAARAMVEKHGDAGSRASYKFAEASAYLTAFEWAQAASRLEWAQQVLQEQCPDRAWVLLSVRYHLSSTWYNLGEHARLAQTVEGWIAEARERNDHVSLSLLAGMGFGFARHLMADAPDSAIAELDEAVSALPAEPYAFPHFGQLVGTSLSLLYRGGPDALQWLARKEQEHGRAFLMRTGMARQTRRLLRSLALLAAAVPLPAPKRGALFDEARRAARTLRTSRSPFERGIAELVLAQLDAVAGARTAALAHALTARTLLEDLGNGHRHAARYVEGILLGSEAGRQACAVASAALAAQGWRAPRRHVRMIAPLLDELGQVPNEALARVAMLGTVAPVESARGEAVGPADAAEEPVRGQHRDRSSERIEAMVDAYFEGRERELRALDDAFERSCDDGLTLVVIEGESGIGKSALSAKFAAWTSETGRARVLRGRCYASEEVALNAFDGMVAELAQLLRGLPNPSCEALLPAGSALLGQLFPVLNSVPAIAQASREGLPADPWARRRAARLTLVELLAKLGMHVDLMLVIDDLQWADGDSLRLLNLLLDRARELPFLCVCTVQSPDERDGDVTDALRALYARPGVTVMQLGALSDGDATRLAHASFGPELSAEACARVVREAHGHPLFLRELVEAERRDGMGGTRPSTLDEALRARVESFDPEARAILELVAIWDRPLAAHIGARARAQHALSRPAVEALVRSGMLFEHGELLVCAHHRIRAVVAAQIEPERRVACARQLAAALAADPDVDTAETARLWVEAQCYEEAISRYEQAGDSALERLAFAHAEQRYGRALALMGSTRDERWQRVLVKRGHALVLAGRSEDAARAFAAAAEVAQGERQTSLRVLAVQHLIKNAQIEDGIRMAKSILRALDEPVPESERAAMIRLVWEVARLKLRGSEVKVDAASSSTHARLVREAVRGLAYPLTTVAPFTALHVMFRYLRGALAAGEVKPTARALAVRALWSATQDPHADLTPQLERSRALADASGDPELRAHVEICWGTSCLQNKFKEAPAHLQAAQEILTSRCPGEFWHLTTARMNLGMAWNYTGAYAALARASEAWIDEARERDDRYAFAALSGFGSGALRHIMAGRPEHALEEIADAMRPWPPTYFSALHVGSFWMTRAARLAMQAGRHDPNALAQLAEDEHELRRATLKRLPMCRFMLHQARLAALLLTVEPGQQPSAEVLTSFKRELKALARNPSQPAAAMAALGQVIARALEGDRARALTDVREVCASLHQIGYVAEHGATYLEGWLMGGPRGAAACDAALAWFATEGFREPRVGLALVLPGAHLLT